VRNFLCSKFYILQDLLEKYQDLIHYLTLSLTTFVVTVQSWGVFITQ